MNGYHLLTLNLQQTCEPTLHDYHGTSMSSMSDIGSGVSLFFGVLMSWGIVVGRVGGVAERPPATGKFSKTGSKTGPPGAFCANCDVMCDTRFILCELY